MGAIGPTTKARRYSRLYITDRIVKCVVWDVNE